MSNTAEEWVPPECDICGCIMSHETWCADRARCELRAALRERDEALAQLTGLQEECDRYGLPLGLQGLLRHIYGNRDLAHAMQNDTIEVWKRRALKAEGDASASGLGWPEALQ